MGEDEQRRPAVVRTDAEPAPPPAATDWTAVYEAQQNAGDGPAGGFLNNQLAKVGCGCVLPLLMLLGTCSSMTTQSYDSTDPAFAFFSVGGSAFAGILLCWAPLFVFWLRDQSKWIIGASFAAMMMFFVIIGFAKIGNGQKALEKDAATVSNLEFDKDGKPIIAPGTENNGPMSKLMVELTRRHSEIRTAFENDIKKAGIDDMMFADRVARKPSLVQNCDRIVALKPVIEDYRTRSMQIIQSTPEQIDRMDISYSMKREMKRGAMSKQAFNIDLMQKQWDLQAKSLEPIHRTCLILSKRNWQPQGTLFAFSNRADMNGFDAAMKELDRYNAELEGLNKTRVDDLKASQAKIKQNIGR
jgi:hypothetical protein